LVTAIGGRVWCGWACPQTVFIDAIFQKIEVWVVGNSRQRRQLQEGPWTKGKIFKMTLKWGLFALVSSHIAHSALGYFVGTHYLLGVTMGSPMEHLPLFFTTLFITGGILFNFGWFREQFCIIMCPYGRFQSVLMDEDSLVVAYNEKRGEPRKHPQDDPEERGDCVNCYQCVRVCPTGIDIRNGTQMECIACTACIDACDNIMEKINKPKGLISYTTEAKLKGGETKILRPRSFFYAGVLLAILSASAYLLQGKDDLRLLIHRAAGAPFSIVEGAGTASNRLIMNHVQLEFYVQSEEKLQLYFEVKDPKWASQIQLVTPHTPFEIKRKGRNVAHVFLKFPEELLQDGSYNTEIVVYSGEDKHSNHSASTGETHILTAEREVLLTEPLTLIGPFK